MDKLRPENAPMLPFTPSGSTTSVKKIYDGEDYERYSDTCHKWEKYREPNIIELYRSIDTKYWFYLYYYSDIKKYKDISWSFTMACWKDAILQSAIYINAFAAF